MTNAEPFADAIAEALRPLVAELVAEELERRLARARPRRGAAAFLTVAQYASVHHTTPARSGRGSAAARSTAIRPPGGREYLIPNAEQAGRSRWQAARTQRPPRRRNVRGRDTGRRSRCRPILPSPAACVSPPASTEQDGRCSPATASQARGRWRLQKLKATTLRDAKKERELDPGRAPRGPPRRPLRDHARRALRRVARRPVAAASPSAPTNTTSAAQADQARARRAARAGDHGRRRSPPARRDGACWPSGRATGCCARSGRC